MYMLLTIQLHVPTMQVVYIPLMILLFSLETGDDIFYKGIQSNSLSGTIASKVIFYIFFNVTERC